MFSNSAFYKFRESKFGIPSLIALLVIFAYGLLFAWQGFYWDDWPFAWILHFFGSLEFIDAFRPFRPFLGYIFSATTFIFGGNPITWQVLGLIIRFLLSYIFWLLLKKVWPSQKSEAGWIVLFFTVFPGYLQQWVSLTHINQELIPLLWLLSSFLAAAIAIRDQKNIYRWIFAAIILQAMGLFSTEYFFGIEIIRYLFIFVIISENKSLLPERFRRFLLVSLPYLIIWMTNAVWLYLYHHSSAYQSYNINNLPKLILSPISLINEGISTISISAFSTWLNTFQLISLLDGTKTQFVTFLVIFLSGIVVYAYMVPGKETPKITTGLLYDKWGFQAAIIGIIAILAGRLPSWAAGLPLKLEFDYDRLMISILPGASILLVGLISIFIKNGKRKILLLSLLVGLSTAYQFNISNSFRRDWNNQKDFFWQMSWRIPSLQKDSVLLTYELPLKYASDFQLTAPINWIYSTSNDNHELNYALFYIKSRAGSAALPSLLANVPIELQYRTSKFKSNTSNSIVIYKESEGCLRILDPVFGSAETVPGANYYLTDAIRLSNLSRIQEPIFQPGLDTIPFGNEPAHDWCYFYEKAELARQQSNWNEITKLHHQAEKSGLIANTPVENLPFIEAYANLDDLETAIQLTEQTLNNKPELCASINTLWKRVLITSPKIMSDDFFQNSIRKINSQINPKSIEPTLPQVISCKK